MSHRVSESNTKTLSIWPWPGQAEVQQVRHFSCHDVCVVNRSQPNQGPAEISTSYFPFGNFPRTLFLFLFRGKISKLKL